MSDAVQLLREQHAEVAALFMKLERLSNPRTCAEIFRAIDAPSTRLDTELPSSARRTSRTRRGKRDDVRHTGEVLTQVSS